MGILKLVVSRVHFFLLHEVLHGDGEVDEHIVLRLRLHAHLKLSEPQAHMAGDGFDQGYFRFSPGWATRKICRSAGRLRRTVPDNEKQVPDQQPGHDGGGSDNKPNGPIRRKMRIIHIAFPSLHSERLVQAALLGAANLAASKPKEGRNRGDCQPWNYPCRRSICPNSKRRTQKRHRARSGSRPGAAKVILSLALRLCFAARRFNEMFRTKLTYGAFYSCPVCRRR